MLRKSALLTAAITVTAGLMIGGSASAIEIAKQAYQAEYELTAPSGKSTHKLSFDGKGHGRSEMISGTRHSISIADYPNQKISILMAEMKQVMTVPLDDKMMESMGELGQKVKSTGKPLGTKMIDGHMCTGTHYDLSGGSTQEIWTGNDIGGVRVYSKVTMPNIGVTESRLKSFSKSAPGPDAFAIPADYSK